MFMTIVLMVLMLMLRLMMVVLLALMVVLMPILVDPGTLWDNVDRPGQLGTLLGGLETCDICPALSSSHRGRVGLLMKLPTSQVHSQAPLTSSTI